MTTYRIDPLADRRWGRLIERHADASVFHTREWLEALRQTYGYEPRVFTTTRPGEELTNGLVACTVESWLTGRRIVSLPFSDHCQPLAENEERVGELFDAAMKCGRAEGCKYVEFRPLRTVGSAWGAGCAASQSFCHHRIELPSNVNELFQRLHKSSVQRKIRRAGREGLEVHCGRSERLLSQFYPLLLRTRRRHHVPPQPRKWFENLIAAFGDALKIWVASRGDRPIAGILTISFRDTLVYKNGCSDERFHELGGMQLLLWSAIEEAQKQGLRSFDMGRSDMENAGLIAFKDHWGTARSELTYVRWSARRASKPARNWKMRFAHRMFEHAPDGVLTTAGNLLYRHMG